ncbi:MAG: 2-dehydropantoate 2-reductase N-terminal domain-containing protein, partial [Vicinamibacteria bacterium]
MARPASRGSRSSTASSEGRKSVVAEVAVVGAGAWGTAIACHLAARAHAHPRVVMIARSRVRADALRR